VLSPAFKKTVHTSAYKKKKRVDPLMFAQLAASLKHLQINTKYVESKIKTTLLYRGASSILMLPFL